MLVKKRDGRLEEFSENKILNSIKKAALAVEGKDDDIQRRAIEIKNLKNKLIESGFDEDEAEEQAELQFEGYLEDGEYTEYDEGEAEEILDIIVESLDGLGLDEEDEITTDELQSIIEKALMISGHAKTAKEYIIKQANRARIREMNTALMKSFEDLTFGNSKDVEKKRENANIDGDSAMGTMLKYGSEGAKRFNLLHLVDPVISEAHSSGDIHIHDLDFMALTETCISKDTKIVIRNDSTGEVRVVEAQQFDMYLDSVDIDRAVELDGISILSGGEFVKIKNCVRHSCEEKRMLRIRTKFGTLDITDEHRIPITRNGVTKTLHARDIKIGDMVKIDGCRDIKPNMKKINLINLFGATRNIVINNSMYVIDEIKRHGLWKEFCSSIGYYGRANSIRYGKCMITLEDYFTHIRKLKCVDENELKLSYRRTRGEETINAIVELSENLGKFIGYMISEGSITSHISIRQESDTKQACFTNYDKNLIEDFNRCVKSVFNNPVLRDRVIDGKHCGTHLSGYLTYELFHGPFGIKRNTGDIELPEWVYSANEEFVSGLLGALIDGDGSVQSDGYRITYTTSSIKLAKGLQDLLRIHGIRSYITERKAAGTIAYFGERESIRKYNTINVNITSDVDDMKWINSFKIRANKNIEREKGTKYKEAEIIGIDTVEDYCGYVYDFETENHHFSANGFYVHNCCQIDLEKLFKNGFNTGHGFLREPGEIRSYAALACISIQSNQNDQHSI